MDKKCLVGASWLDVVVLRGAYNALHILRCLVRILWTKLSNLLPGYPWVKNASLRILSSFTVSASSIQSLQARHPSCTTCLCLPLPWRSGFELQFVLVFTGVPSSVGFSAGAHFLCAAEEGRSKPRYGNKHTNHCGYILFKNSDSDKLFAKMKFFGRWYNIEFFKIQFV